LGRSPEVGHDVCDEKTPVGEGYVDLEADPPFDAPDQNVPPHELGFTRDRLWRRLGVSNGFANEALAIELRPLDSRVHATEPRGGDHALSFLIERCSDPEAVNRAQQTNLRTYPT
jgi:hypothetical protein